MTPAAEQRGLSSEEAARRRAQDGPNSIEQDHGPRAWAILLRQFVSPLTLLLMGAAVVSALLGETLNAAAIAGIVAINGIVGFFHEHRAVRAVRALRAMTQPQARVIRDGRRVPVPASDIVVGDLLTLDAGDVVAADARIVEAHALATNEASLTGESTPVQKGADSTPPGSPLAERRDFVFMGTAAVAGTGVAEVTAIGMRTELGRIAHLLATVEKSETPLQARLAAVARSLSYASLLIVAVVALVGFLRGSTIYDVFMSAVSLAVAAVPEGLPAMVTVALAIGVRRMAVHHALVRRLAAVETLGSTTVICTDKTGTLTTGIMTVRELWGDDHARLLDAATACCDAELGDDNRTGIGDPTEIAILAAAAERGICREDIERDRPRVEVKPFDAASRRMSVLRTDGMLYVKGAVEAVLPLCLNGHHDVTPAHAEMAERGLRVLAVATGHGREKSGMRLVGLIGIADPPRPEAVKAVAAARSAGVRTVMVTGDHALTARAIAREIGILAEGDAEDHVVHARVTAEEKLRIIREWKAGGAIVAMTGDGVNDAPALREADVGVAMGRTGTDVTREAADIVLTDDNFASIVAAIREGRGIFDNIRTALVYLLSGNAAELALMLAAALAGLPLPLLPIHLLWINLVTDGLPAVALVFDPARDEVLQQPPRPPDEPMLGRPQWIRVLAIGTVEAAVTLTVFVTTLRTHDLHVARTALFTAVVFAELLRSFGARLSAPIHRIPIRDHVTLAAIVLLTGLIQVGIQYFPVTRSLFGLVPLPLDLWVVVAGAAATPLAAIELFKLQAAWRREGRTF